MDNKPYKKQVALILRVIPEVAKETCFALHGGTAINLFVREMPRLSVDIDLTYVPIEDRQTSLKNISDALQRIELNIQKTIPGVRIQHQQNYSKLQISNQGIQIKVEVNQTIRGTMGSPQRMILCDKAQTEFDVFCSIAVVPFGQLYGGKICAALDRQHPRDLFDVKYLLENEGFTEEIKTGFLLGLLSSNRPLNEIVSPNFQDQRLTMANHFDGMSFEAFSYEEFESIRQSLLSTIHDRLTKKDKDFLLSVKNVTPDWTIYNFEAFPAVQWKLLNLQKLKSSDPKKHGEQFEALKEKLGE